MQFGPGSYLTANNRYAQMLQAQQPNNGTTYGGLAHALNQGLAGWMMGKDTRQQEAANQALLSGLRPQQMPEGVQGPPQPGSYQTAMQNLQGMEGNEYAGRLAQQLMVADMQRQQEMAATQSNRAFQEGLLDKRQSFEEKLTDKKLRSAESIAEDRRAAAGKYYAVPSGSGYILIDKGTGMAVRMGIDANGQMSQIGQPFRPMMDTLGQPTAMPQDMPISPQPPSGASPAPLPTQVNPLMPPSVDPTAQGNVARSKAQATADVKRGEEGRDAAAKAQIQFAPLDRLSETVDEILTAPGMEARTGYSSYLPPQIQGQEAQNFEAKKKTLTSQVAQNVLQMYRSMSQTGGAVGQVSNFEQELFINNLAALDQAQSAEEFRLQLQKIKRFVEDSKNRISAAHKMQFGSDLPNAPAGEAPQANDEDLFRKYGVQP